MLAVAMYVSMTTTAVVRARHDSVCNGAHRMWSHALVKHKPTQYALHTCVKTSVCAMIRLITIENPQHGIISVNACELDFENVSLAMSSTTNARSLATSANINVEGNTCNIRAQRSPIISPIVLTRCCIDTYSATIP